jgi:hypothetical protein
MPAKNEKKETTNQEEEITVDMTTAKTLAPLDPTHPYLVAVSKWKYGLSAQGKKKVDYGFTVIEPAEDEGRTVAGSSSLENEYTLGTVKGLLKGLGMSDEKLNSTKFKMPKAGEIEGLQAMMVVRTRAAQGVYSERSEISRLAPAAEYTAKEE